MMRSLACSRRTSRPPHLSARWSVLSAGMAAAFLAFTAAVAPAQELDFELSSGSTLSGQPAAEDGAGAASDAEGFLDSGDRRREFDQLGRLAAEFRWDLGTRLRLQAGGFVTFSGSFDGSAADGSAAGDLTSLSLQGEFPLRGGGVDQAGADRSPFQPGPVLSFTLGRQPATDFSGFVMDTRLDGASVSYTNAAVDAELLAGYTGLRLRNSSEIIAAPMETADADNLFAPSQGIGQLTIAFPELISRQSLLFTGIGRYDLPELPTSETTAGTSGGGTGGGNADAGSTAGGPEGRYHALHVGTGLTGPLSTRLFYTIFGFYHRPWFHETEGAVSTGNAAAAGASLRLYLEERAFSTLEARVAYASGAAGQLQRVVPVGSTIDDGEGDSGAGDGSEDGAGAAVFVPVTDPAITALLPLQFSNAMVAEARYSFRPFAPAYPSNTGAEVEFLVQGAARPGEGVGTLSGLDPGTPAAYLGTLAGTSIQYRPTSDLNLLLEIGSFWPSQAAIDAGAALDGGPGLRTSLEAQLRF